MRLLLVEDHPSLASAIVRYLSKRGFSVTHCAEIEPALEAIRTGSWDGIICDLWIARTPAAVPLRSAWAQTPNRNAPFILMTGQEMGEALRAQLDGMDGLESMDAIIQKPFTLSEFAAQIDLALKGRVQRGEA